MRLWYSLLVTDWMLCLLGVMLLQVSKPHFHQYDFLRVSIQVLTPQCVCMHAGNPVSNQGEINKSLMFPKETPLSTCFPISFLLPKFVIFKREIWIYPSLKCQETSSVCKIVMKAVWFVSDFLRMDLQFALLSSLDGRSDDIMGAAKPLFSGD